MDEVLEKIRDFADRSHGDQMRKYSPERYIVHPVRVMKICREYTDDITVLAAALLHDVLEDTPVNREAILGFLSTVVPAGQATAAVALVEELTDVYVKKNYPKWNRHKRKAKEAQRLSAISGDAQTVKYADIIDNSSAIVTEDADFAPVFLKEYKALLKLMNKGNKELYRRAVDVVENNLRQL